MRKLFLAVLLFSFMSQGGEVTFSFQIIDDNSLEFNDQEDTFIFTKTSEQFNPTGCINGTLDGYAW